MAAMFVAVVPVLINGCTQYKDRKTTDQPGVTRIELQDQNPRSAGNATGNTGNNNSGNGIQSSAGLVTGGVNGIFFHGGNTATGNSAANFNNNPPGFIGP